MRRTESYTRNRYEYELLFSAEMPAAYAYRVVSNLSIENAAESREYVQFSFR